MSQIHPTFPATGFLRLSQILSLFPVGKSSWWRGVKEGRYPKPVRLAPRTSAWRAEDIAALIASLCETVDWKINSGGKK